MSRFVQYDEFGSRDNLRVISVEPPQAGPGELRVRVLAAGLNPVDFKIFNGPAAKAYGASLPSGVGNDFAGLVDQVGDGVTGFEPGDAVLGGKRHAAEADFVVVEADAVIPMPRGLTFEVAGCLQIAGRTAVASVEHLGIDEDDTVFVSAAAGGVGILAAQLAIRAGAIVVGTASIENHDFLSSLGVIPVEYGDGMVDRLRDALPDGTTYTAALDNHGPASIDAALALGIPIERINTIAAFGPANRGASTVGGAAATNDDLAEVAQLLADGELVLPIDSVYPIERVVEAYERLERGHVRGKIVLVTE